MQIVDAQVHAWSEGNSTGHHRRTPITAGMLLDEMAAAGVDRALIVPPLWDPSGNEYALRMAREHPDRFAAMGVIQFGDWQATGWRSRLARWNEQPGMRGVRFLFNDPGRIKPYLDGAFDDVWPVLEENGTAVALLVPNALDVAAAIAGRHPGLRIIVDHLGVPRGASGPDTFRHLPELLALARHPNIAVKAAGVGDYAPEGYPFPSLDGPLERIFDAFGPERIVWASELSRLRHPYRRCVTHFTEELDFLSEADKALVMGGNICRIVGWDAGALREPELRRTGAS